jgi:trehalose synthase
LLEKVEVGTQAIDGYAASAGADIVESLRALAESLQGVRVLHVNATPYGGGVAEILRSEIPLLRDLGLLADWKLITGDDDFFSVTKTMHNALQGGERGLTADERATYMRQSTQNAALLDERYDIVVVHDPQPLALPALRGEGDTRWIWRCHIDTSEPNPEVWSFLRPFLEPYDIAVFTLGGFVPPEFPVRRVAIVPPAIDPESPKNMALDPALARRVLSWIGVDVTRPLVTQISRFDSWKDPLGVIAAYRLVKDEVPDLQLALAGSMALDDPEGWDVYRQIQEAARDDPDVRVFTNLTGVGNIEVNAFQRCSEVVIQKSIREGFGLVISESLWKGTPVVAGRAGGIPLQLNDGGGYLVDSVEECAQRVRELLADPDARQTQGEAGRRVVRDRFLLTRLIADDLRLYSSALGDRPPVGPRGVAGLDGEPRDPVCGMRIDPATALRQELKGHAFFFCSRACAHEFARDPNRFLRGSPDVAQQPR